MTREPSVRLDAMELKVCAEASIGIIGRLGLKKVRHLDLSYLSRDLPCCFPTKRS